MIDWESQESFERRKRARLERMNQKPRITDYRRDFEPESIPPPGLLKALEGHGIIEPEKLFTHKSCQRTIEALKNYEWAPGFPYIMRRKEKNNPFPLPSPRKPTIMENFENRLTEAKAEMCIPRETVISPDDITNVRIVLGNCDTVEEFLNEI